MATCPRWRARAAGCVTLGDAIEVCGREAGGNWITPLPRAEDCRRDCSLARLIQSVRPSPDGPTPMMCGKQATTLQQSAVVYLQGLQEL